MDWSYQILLTVDAQKGGAWEAESHCYPQMQLSTLSSIGGVVLDSGQTSE